MSSKICFSTIWLKVSDQIDCKIFPKQQLSKRTHSGHYRRKPCLGGLPPSSLTSTRFAALLIVIIVAITNLAINLTSMDSSPRPDHCVLFELCGKKDCADFSSADSAAGCSRAQSVAFPLELHCCWRSCTVELSWLTFLRLSRLPDALPSHPHQRLTNALHLRQTLSGSRSTSVLLPISPSEATCCWLGIPFSSFSKQNVR